MPKTAIFFAALFVTICISAIIPTPNNVNGGSVKMFFIIFVTVFFKVVFELIWTKFFKK